MSRRSFIRRGKGSTSILIGGRDFIRICTLHNSAGVCYTRATGSSPVRLSKRELFGTLTIFLSTDSRSTAGSLVEHYQRSSFIFMPKYGRLAQRKVEKVMNEYKHGRRSSGRSGKKVKSRKQAIAIGLSEARRRGGKVPPLSRRRRKSGAGPPRKRRSR